MNETVWMYFYYTLISVSFTAWVAHTLHKNGRIFLVECFRDEALADSVNHLLVVGFYLINIGFICLALKTQDSLKNLQDIVEVLSGKVGAVLMVLGIMHFINLTAFSKVREWGKAKNEATVPPPWPQQQQPV